MAQFDGSEGNFIPIEKAAQFTRNYRNSQQFNLNKEVKALFYGRDKLLEILNQDGCMGLRIYFGLSDGTVEDQTFGDPQFIIIGADADGNNQSNGQTLDNGYPCPDYCPDQEEDPPLGSDG